MPNTAGVESLYGEIRRREDMDIYPNCCNRPIGLTVCDWTLNWQSNITRTISLYSLVLTC